MNPESLLHAAAEQLRLEAKRGPGMMFVMFDAEGLTITRTPRPERIKDIITKFDCESFTAGLTASRWAVLLKTLWTTFTASQKGSASGQQPTKKS